jgi:hypothetical protein
MIMMLLSRVNLHRQDGDPTNQLRHSQPIRTRKFSLLQLTSFQSVRLLHATQYSSDLACLRGSRPAGRSIVARFPRPRPVRRPQSRAADLLLLRQLRRPRSRFFSGTSLSPTDESSPSRSATIPRAARGAEAFPDAILARS